MCKDFSLELSESLSLIERHWRRSVQLIATIELLSARLKKNQSLRGFATLAFQPLTKQ